MTGLGWVGSGLGWLALSACCARLVPPVSGVAVLELAEREGKRNRERGRRKRKENEERERGKRWGCVRVFKN